jgi:hypothetical protein
MSLECVRWDNRTDREYLYNIITKINCSICLEQNIVIPGYFNDLYLYFYTILDLYQYFVKKYFSTNPNDTYKYCFDMELLREKCKF